MDVLTVVLYGSSMPLTIGSNISSLLAQRQLFSTESQLSTVFQRLASGQRINRASDDAAGLAVSMSLNVDQRVYTQGIRNLNDGLSLLQIADSTIENLLAEDGGADGLSLLSVADSTVEELTGIVLRLQELATQSANGTFSYEQRQSLDLEAQALAEEYFRVSRSAEFNGQKLFDGSLETALRLQAGYGSNGGIESSLGGVLGDGTFGAEISYSTGTTGGSSYRTVEVGDVNGDGIQDLVVSDSSPSEFAVLLGNGDGSFRDPIVNSGTGLDIRSMSLADINNDGILDLVTAGATSGSDRVEIYLGTGTGEFQSVDSVAVGNTQLDVELADLNNDGILDLVSGGLGSTTTVALGVGDGSFGPTTTYAEGATVLQVALEDVNGDGILDLITGETSEIGIRLGTGDGGFGSESTFSGSVFGMSGLLFADINSDGIADLITAGSGGGDATFDLYLGNGDGTFQSNLTNAFSDYTDFDDIEIADLNGDGNLDIAATVRDNNLQRLAFFLGDGTGSFNAPTTYDIGRTGFQQYTDISLGDFNEDGVLDAVYAGREGTAAYVRIGETREGINPLLEFDLGTIGGARQALSLFDQKLEQLTSQRAVIGAFQSRIGAAISVLGSTTENVQAAEGRIVDADIAAETANLVRLQILRESAAAILSQANQQPALAIQLLS